MTPSSRAGERTRVNGGLQRLLSRLVSLIALIALALQAAALFACARTPPASSPIAGGGVAAGTTLTSVQVSSPVEPLMVAGAPPPGPSAVPTLDQWAWRYPDAARELGRWIVVHPDTARSLATWQRRHPEQMEALVDWSTTHPYESLGSLFFDRAGWGELRGITGGDEDALGFMGWIRRAPHAARELAFYSNGLAFLEGELQTLLHVSYSVSGMQENPLLRRAPERPAPNP
jgi:hypothetical protein